MIKPDFAEFSRLYSGSGYIPVYQEMIGDLETPVSLLARLADAEHVFLLESVEGGERFGRYSFLGVNARAVFEIRDGMAYVHEGGQTRQLSHTGNPLEALRGILADRQPAELPGLPPFVGGAVGFLGYEAVNLFEELPPPKAALATPEACFMITDEIIVFDNVRHTLKILAGVRPDASVSPRAAYDDAVSRIGALQAVLQKPLPEELGTRAAITAKLTGNMDREEFCEKVERARHYIHDGEAIQIVLSQKFTATATSTPLQLYRALRLINPSPYMFFVKLGTMTLVGSSPETMVKLENGRSSLLPIAGTRKRSADMLEDIRLADELLRDEKERAEHLMLVDLGRNDLGRTARPGSVQVKSFMHVERYSHVMHIVSEVEAMLRPDCDAFDLVSSVFPAGTLSGAPKIRAMELIHELENEPRGIYGGAVGYFGYNGNMDLAITIRTMAIQNGLLSIQVGAGIVHDSKPEAEYEETLNKAAAMFKAVKLAANGLEME